ncbi:MAG: SUMF1/EgtB/PvdO family nonheme iron enzyme, partial [Ignavibacteria bacterium]|nr:SUMF1/EgtB/PvdO family nonheme iron enzyme [Ignavibacteria bacterium]
MTESELIKISGDIFSESFSDGFPGIITFKKQGIPPFRLKYLPGGSFMMGDDKSNYNEEKPSHQVELSPYYMAEFPVTQNLYEAVAGKNPSAFKGDRKPVERVTWFDAVNFCNRLNTLAGLPECYKKSGKENISCNRENP